MKLAGPGLNTPKPTDANSGKVINSSSDQHSRDEEDMAGGDKRGVKRERRLIDLHEKSIVWKYSVSSRIFTFHSGIVCLF